MRNFITKSVLIILFFQLLNLPVFADNHNRVIEDPASGMSFRKTDLQQLKGPAASETPESDLISKGTMMTEPSMSGLTYQVHILGEVKSPGTYRITASDRLSEVLQRAGGLDEQGSMRNMELRRKGEGTRKVDLLKFQILGDLSDNPYLLDNDVVYVPLKKSVIQIVGAVKRPKEYELRNEHTLSEVVTLAGGFSVGEAKDSLIRIVRFVDNKKEVLEVTSNESDMAKFEIHNGDVVFIPHMITEKNNFDYDIPKLPGDNIFYPSYEDRVFILGGVGQPGAFPFNPYYKLSQYLSLAGGTTQMATNKITVVAPGGKSHVIKNKEKASYVINPGDTVIVGQRRIAPEGWLSLGMGVAGFGLSTMATVLALTR